MHSFGGTWFILTGGRGTQHVVVRCARFSPESLFLFEGHRRAPVV